MSTTGLVAFIVWNVLAVAMVSAVMLSFRKRLHA
jgi:hypothetical protein